MKKYKLTDEHEKQLKPWADKWIKNAMSTRPIEKDEIPIIKKHVKGLYESAGLTPPPDHRIIIVSSPFIARFAGGFAAWIWHLRKKQKSTTYATFNATDAATRDATFAATRAATFAATDAATRAATDDATDDAKYDTKSANYSKWYVVNGDMRKVAGVFGDVKSLLDCASKAYKLYQGGNLWSGWCAMISFFRYIAKLPIDYSKWDHYEKLAELSSYRIVHSEFCIISDRPEKLMVDDQNRPHCDDGPFCRWRDGSELYSIHGVKVPAWIVKFPERITIEDIQKENNLEVQRIMIERFGVDKYLIETGAEVIDTDFRGIDGGGARCLMREKSGEQWLVCTDGSTERVYHLSVSRSVITCKQAHEELCGFDENLLTMEG